MSLEHLYLIALGSNLRPRCAYLQKGIRALGREGLWHDLSRFYETPPLGPGDFPYLNGCGIFATKKSPEELLALLKAIERDSGRLDTIRWGNRTLDLDIILWRKRGGAVASFESSVLSIPHKEAESRDFVLIPANEIASDWELASGLSIKALVEKKGMSLLGQGISLA